MKSLLLTRAALCLLAATPAFAYATEIGPKASIGQWGVDTKGLSKLYLAPKERVRIW